MKLKRKTIKRIQGSISILLVIILMPMMTLSALIVDTSRMNMAKSMVSGAGDMAMNSALADYDSVVKDVYGLFAMSQEKTDDELAADIKDYFVKTVMAQGVVPSEAEGSDYVDALFGDFNQILNGTYDEEVSNLLSMEANNFTVTKVPNSNLANPDILRKQIVEYMKYRGPVTFGMSFLDAAKSFTTVSNQAEVVELQVVAEEKLQGVSSSCADLMEKIRKFDEKIDEINEKNPVVGLRASNDTTGVGIEQYATQAANYMGMCLDNGNGTSGFFENYGVINTVYVMFLYQAPFVKDMYLSKKPSDFITVNGMYCIDNTDSGVNISVSKSGDAKTLFDNQLSTVNGYKAIADQFTNHLSGFVTDAQINEFIAAFYTWNGSPGQQGLPDGLENGFIEYEKFILNSGTIKYSDVSPIFEELYRLSVLHDNYDKELKDSLVEPTNKLSRLTGTIKSNIDTLNSYDSEKQSLENDLATAEAKAASTNVSVAKEAKKEVKEIEKQLENLDKDRERAYNKIKSDSDFSSLADNPGGYQSKVDELNAIIDDINAKIAKARSDYAQAAGKFKDFENAYRTAMDNYRSIQDKAYFVVDGYSREVYKQFNQIIDNLEDVVKALDDIEGNIDDLINKKVKNYDAAVTSWKNGNASYVADNGNDSFSEQNKMDIAATKKEVSEDNVKELSEYVAKVKKIYADLLSNIKHNDYYKYAGKKVYKINGYGDIADSDLKRITKNEDAVIHDYADSYGIGVYNTGYAGNDIDAYDLDFGDTGLYFLKPVLGIPFLQYLAANFPEEDKSSDEAKATKKNYEELKKTLNNENDGDSVEKVIENTETQTHDESNPGAQVFSGASTTNKFGYADTAIMDSNLALSGLPSDILSSVTKAASSTSLEMDTGGGYKSEVNASNGMKKQKESTKGILAGIGNIASAGMEDLYILEYIFENFSYNTIVQDEINRGNAETISASAANLTADKIDAAKKQIKTLSNYDISLANNYMNGAEIEYIIYGNPKPSTNVAYAKSSIYAIRMIFNSVYAFKDSEIRNATKTIGLAVQSATCGVVPYQVVQIVLQLALAAAESGMDLAAMNNGVEVAVVKTKDTWTLSPSNALNAAGTFVTDALSRAATDGISRLTAGLQNVADAGVEELESSIYKLSEDMQVAIKDKVQSIIDTAFEYVDVYVSEALSDLSTKKLEAVSGIQVYTYAEVEAIINETFEENVYSKIDTIDVDCFKDAPDLARKVFDFGEDTLKGLLRQVVDESKAEFLAEVKAVYDSAPGLPSGADVYEVVNEYQATLKENLIAKIDRILFEDNTLDRTLISRVSTEYLDTAKDQLDTYLSQISADMTEEVCDGIKESVGNFTTNFMNSYMTEGIVPVDTGITKSNPSTGTVIRFGYKDYLMLFTFLGLITNDESILSRVGDVIEINVKNSSEGRGSQFVHNKGADFSMSKAYTYISINTDIELDMLLIRGKFFNRMFEDGVTDVDDAIRKGSTFKYTGILGY